MSFSSRVKEELSRQLSPARHCRIAEIAAILSLCGRVQISERNRYRVKIYTENAAVARKYFTLLKKTFNIRADVSIRQGVKNHRGRTYAVCVGAHEDALRVLQAVKLIDRNGEIEENLSLAQNVVIMQNCCKRAFIRGAFLAAGSISDPEKFYHFEIACQARAKALQLQGLILSFGLDGKIVQRKKYFVVYIKEGSQIVDILNVMEAPVALMELENIRIVKEMRGSVNRKVNCETANINKTVSAAVKQMEDITLIRDTVGFGNLPVCIAKTQYSLSARRFGVHGSGGRARKMRRIVMIKKTITIGLASGLEARAIAMLVQIASQYESRIYVENSAARVNAKSIMGMMTLSLGAGESITVSAEGADEDKAMDEIETYLTGEQ